VNGGSAAWGARSRVTVNKTTSYAVAGYAGMTFVTLLVSAAVPQAQAVAGQGYWDSQAVASGDSQERYRGLPWPSEPRRPTRPVPSESRQAALEPFHARRL
jgi:hypothetical protein